MSDAAIVVACLLRIRERFAYLRGAFFNKAHDLFVAQLRVARLEARQELAEQEALL